jgi:hypothetical protein
LYRSKPLLLIALVVPKKYSSLTTHEQQTSRANTAANDTRMEKRAGFPFSQSAMRKKRKTTELLSTVLVKWHNFSFRALIVEKNVREQVIRFVANLSSGRQQQPHHALVATENGADFPKVCTLPYKKSKPDNSHKWALLRAMINNCN